MSKTKNLKELRSKDIKSLKALVHEKTIEIAKKKMEVVSGKEKNVKLPTILRRELAKILTLVKEKEILAKLEKGKEEIK